MSAVMPSFHVMVEYVDVNQQNYPQLLGTAEGLEADRRGFKD